jgi:DNA (cytosine-5)-methyltransferase 1
MPVPSLAASVTVVAPPLVLLVPAPQSRVGLNGDGHPCKTRLSRVPLLSMFTGGGFMDIGFEQAGFEIAWSNEINAEFAAMFVSARTGMNIPGARRKPRKPNQTCVTNLKSAEIIREAFGSAKPKLFGMIGGPPCPDFSRGGLNGGSTGRNGRLTAVFVRLLCKIKPAFFVIENVPGLLHTKKHRRFFEKQVSILRTVGKFLVDFRILNSLQFGAPQDRERLFVIGVRKTLAYEAIGRRVAADTVGWFPWPVDLATTA